MINYSLNLDAVGQLTDETFYQLCRRNPDLKFERNRQGEIIIMSPTGGETGNVNAELLIEFGFWNRQYKLGKLFDSSTCFKLPNGANRSPDIAWIRQERWDNLTPNQKEKFPPISPDFVLELLSPSDALKETQIKMQEYQENGVKLGWLINLKTYQVEIYRQTQPKEMLTSPQTLSGENILPNFTLNYKLFGNVIP
ncbi:Uma2 family endonuclease [Crocosphaera sp. UHCC 0190]|uniref:Uma2 family endonuclease n=1 Tax=Crocosphaera sp. UHCC 0190 TaxID=3110246 RepID=UPI002B1F1070|nr:Uma2 family endonuclease [Crocosphaera sp. UHCC 0190]MEA5512060.1 Uma2 family endonuclease [Crocosphaera sp. UHCC 0190]